MNEKDDIFICECAESFCICEHKNNQLLIPTKFDTPIITIENIQNKQPLIIFDKHQATIRLPQNKTYKCIYCSYEFESGTFLIQHIRLNHRHVCNKCGKRFQSDKQLVEHMSVHCNERRYICVICGKKYKFPSGLNKHLRSVHC